MVAMEESAGQARGEVGQRGEAVNNHHAGVATYVAKGFVMGTGDYVSPVATH